MISHVEINHQSIDIFFENYASGTIKCNPEGRTITINKEKTINIFVDCFFSDTIKFFNKEKNEVSTYTFNPSLNCQEIISPIERKRMRDNGIINSVSTFFISRNICKNKENDIFFRANASLVMGYRALEEYNSSILNESYDIISRILQDLEGQTNREFNNKVKQNKEHCIISNLYLQMQISVALNDEKKFVISANNILKKIKSIKNTSILKWSYYSISMAINMIALYKYELTNKLYYLSFELFKKSIEHHDANDTKTKIYELEISFKRLTQLQRLAQKNNDSDFKEDDIFYSSFRIAKNSSIYDNFKTFKKDLEVFI
ncbi:hypothetical protein [Salinivibrio kushneri]|uniref:hypothetical protein n=1 Tax=Salinivibrio kushneri TaxID=1908198 RepID=UPI0022B56C8B|nr:hypothetical protein [Salinivibrio kushneri]WBA17128.1 hypothetical protein O4598_08210 [Salinivibrio kushneri]